MPVASQAVNPELRPAGRTQLKPCPPHHSHGNPGVFTVHVSFLGGQAVHTLLSHLFSGLDRTSPVVSRVLAFVVGLNLWCPGQPIRRTFRVGHRNEYRGWTSDSYRKVFARKTIAYPATAATPTLVLKFERI